jgi:uncharacterized membrane protein YkoI
MKMITRKLITLICLAAFIAGSVVGAANKEQKAPKGTLHPGAKVKPADLPALAKVSFQQAMAAAQASVPGPVLKGELEVEDGCLMYSFEIVGPGKKVTEVEIDAGNGKVLEDDEEAENEKDEKKN